MVNRPGLASFQGLYCTHCELVYSTIGVPAAAEVVV